MITNAAPILVALATFSLAWMTFTRNRGHPPRPIERIFAQFETPHETRVSWFTRRGTWPLFSHADTSNPAPAAIEQLIQGAGGPVSTRRFVVLTVALGLGGGLWVALLGGRAGMPGPLTAALTLAAATAGAAIPYVWLYGRRERRLKRIQRELPDHLDLLVVSVEAGLTFDAALSRIVEHGRGELTVEFRRMLAELELGVSRRAALQALVARANTPGVAALVAAVLQAERTGMEIGPILRSQAERLRLQRRQLAAEAALKAPVKMLFPLVMFIFPSVFVVLLGPAVITLMRTFGER